MAPQFGLPASFPPAQQSQQQPGIPPRPAIPQPPQSQPVQPQHQPSPNARPPLTPHQNPTGPPTRSPGEVSTASVSKDPVGSVYNANPPASRGTPNMPFSTDTHI